LSNGFDEPVKNEIILVLTITKKKSDKNYPPPFVPGLKKCGSGINIPTF
jgi:hypothetical protein